MDPLVTLLGSEEVHPGLSELIAADATYEAIQAVLEPLVEAAEAAVPAAVREHVHVVIKATAGARLLPRADRHRLTRSAVQVWRDAGWAATVGVIPGPEEALLAYIAANYAADRTFASVEDPACSGTSMIDGETKNGNQEKISEGAGNAGDRDLGDSGARDPLNQPLRDDRCRGSFASVDTRRHVGIMDLGGASTQVAFALPSPASRGTGLFFVHVAGGRVMPVHAHSWLNFGKHRAHTVLTEALAESGEPSPCLPGNHAWGGVQGSANHTECKREVRRVLLERLRGEAARPGAALAQLPPHTLFVTYDNFWRTMRRFNLTDPRASLAQLDAAAEAGCTGLTVPSDRPVSPWLRDNCFCAAWIAVLAGDWYGLDSASHDRLHHSESLGGTALSWTLGVAVADLASWPSPLLSPEIPERLHIVASFAPGAGASVLLSASGARTWKTVMCLDKAVAVLGLPGAQPVQEREQWLARWRSEALATFECTRVLEYAGESPVSSGALAQVSNSLCVVAGEMIIYCIYL